MYTDSEGRTMYSVHISSVHEIYAGGWINRFEYNIYMIQRVNKEGIQSWSLPPPSKKRWSVVVCAEAFFQQMQHTIRMLHFDPHLAISVSLPLSPGLFHLSSTKHRFTVLSIKADIHAANYQWKDSFGLVSVPHQPSSFSILAVLGGPLDARLAFSDTYISLGPTQESTAHGYGFQIGVSSHLQTGSDTYMWSIYYLIAPRERSALGNWKSVFNLPFYILKMSFTSY